MDKRAFIRHVRNWEVDLVKRDLAVEPVVSSHVDQTGKTPLHHCAGVDARLAKVSTMASVEIADALVRAGGDVNAVRIIIDEGEEFRATPLWYAVAWGKNFELAKFLLTAGAEPLNCMWAACWDQAPEMAELLRSFGAEVDPVFQNETPLLQIVKSKRLRLLGWLVQNGANINFQDGDGFTALHYAVKRNHNQIQIQELLSYGADPQLRAHNGSSAISLARKQGRTKIASLLEQSI